MNHRCLHRLNWNLETIYRPIIGVCQWTVNQTESQFNQTMQQHIQQSFQFVQWLTILTAWLSIYCLYPRFAYDPKFRRRWWLLAIIMISTYAFFYCQLGMMTEGKTFHSPFASFFSFCIRSIVGIAIWAIFCITSHFDDSSLHGDDSPYR